MCSSKRIILIVNWLELFVQEVDSESFESVDTWDLKTFSWNCRPLPSSCNFTRDAATMS